VTAVLILLGLLAAVGVFLPHPAAPLGGLGLALGLAVALEPTSVRRAWRVRTVTFVVLLSLLTAAGVASIAGPTRGLVVGGAVLIRFLTLVLLATVAARRLNTETILAAAARSGIRPLGLILGLALNTLPQLTQTLWDAWTALAVRSPSGRVPWRRLPLLAETLLAHTGRLADDAAVAAALRGHAALGLRPAAAPAGAGMVVVTGPPGSGKTAAIAGALAALQSTNLALAGFVQEATWEEGRKTGFILRDLRSGVTAPLADRADGDRGEHGTRFRFHPEGFALARRALTGVRHAEILVADELGPVELRGGGHMPALRRALRRAPGAVLLCTVRRHLLPSLLAELHAGDVVIVDMGEHNNPAAVVAAAVTASLRPGNAG